MSHLSVADSEQPDDRAFTEEQTRRFQACLETARELGIRPRYIHLANSAGTIRDLPGFNLVRPGLMLYGLHPAPALRGRIPLRPVLRWKTAILSVKRVPAGETVSYGRTHCCPKESLVAVLPVGYADGYSRRFSNRGEVLVRGKRAKIAGIVCMDLTMADVSEIPDVQPGEEVVLLGKQGSEEISAAELAAGPERSPTRSSAPSARGSPGSTSGEIDSISEMILSLFNIIGLRTLRFLDESGRVMMLLSKTLLFIFRPPFDARNLLKQIEYVGVKSIPVVLITGAFTGMVLALQSYTGFKRFNAEAFVGTVVALSMTRELGPVLSGLMVSGRVGSAMAAELGTMQVTEQIDALYTLAINPINYLVVPRFLASLIIMPILTAFADVVGILGGLSDQRHPSGHQPHGLHPQDLRLSGPGGYLHRASQGLRLRDDHRDHRMLQGFNTRGGAEGVGKATTNAVVISSLLILVANYFVTALLF